MIEQVRVKKMGKVWMLSVIAALFWSVVCVRQGNVLFGLANFILGFLPLWKQLYVDTPFYTIPMAWIVMIATFVFL
jgi:hypothetical protein